MSSLAALVLSDMLSEPISCERQHLISGREVGPEPGSASCAPRTIAHSAVLAIPYYIITSGGAMATIAKEEKSTDRFGDDVPKYCFY